MSNKIKLMEASDLFIYEDSESGKKYLFDGTKLVELPNNPTPSGGSESKNDSTEVPDENDTQEKSQGASKSQDDETEDGGGSDDGQPNEQSQASTDNRSKGGGEQSQDEDSEDEDSEDQSSESANTDLDDIDLDNINWDDLENAWDNLSDEEKQVIRDGLDKIDKAILEREEKERQEQIERELDAYDPDSEEAEARLAEIANDLADESKLNDILNDSAKKIQQDRQKRKAEKKAAERAANEYEANSGIADFVIDLNRLIKSEVKKISSSSWGRINKKAEGTGIIKPGKTKRKNPEIPRLFVYFDNSSSWGSSDIEVGKQAISTLNKYVEKNQLIIELYYFADHISTTPTHGATGAGAELIEHIRINKPDNVMVMTDSDFDVFDEILQAPRVTVPGGVFLLFRQGNVSKRLVDRLKGKKLNKLYKFY